MQDQKLMDYFKFDEGDLQANRDGYLTDKQKARVLQDQKYTKMAAFTCGGVLAIIAVAMLIVALVSVFQPGNWGIVLLFIVIAVVLGFIVSWALRPAFATVEIKVQKAEGPINIVKEQYRDSHEDTITNYELYVGSRRFEVRASLANIMAQGDVYAIYFAKYAKNQDADILSVEFISKAN